MPTNGTMMQYFHWYYGDTNAMNALNRSPGPMRWNRRIALFCLFAVIVFGCTAVPCYPPEHYRPDADAPYTAEEVRVPTTERHVLAGTLTLPSDSDPPFPVVLLITGSGLQERDHSATRRVPFAHYKPFRQIADALSRHGIAVLRMDDQGVGCSEGGPLQKITIRERADDSRAGIAYLRHRKEIDPQRMGLLGLSEGGNIGPMIAASDSTIRALVIIGGSATNGYKIIEYQRQCKINERSDLSAAEKELELARSMAGLRKALSRGEGSPWFRSFIRYMPLPAAKQVACPVLILHGDRDAHVPVEHAHMLAKVMRFSGNEDVTLTILADHNHLLLEDASGSISGYSQLLTHTNQLSEHVLSVITEWLVAKLGQSNPRPSGRGIKRVGRGLYPCQHPYFKETPALRPGSHPAGMRKSAIRSSIIEQIYDQHPQQSSVLNRSCVLSIALNMYLAIRP